MSNIFEDLEDLAGHKLTLAANMLAGVSTYYCENCGALIKLSSSGRVGGPEVVLFHVPNGCESKVDDCQRSRDWSLAEHPNHVLLRTKLTSLMLDGFVKMQQEQDEAAD